MDDLVRRQVVAVIVANSTSAFAVKAATTTIPMVFLTGSDPIEGGLVTKSTGRVTTSRGWSFSPTNWERRGWSCYASTRFS